MLHRTIAAAVLAFCLSCAVPASAELVMTAPADVVAGSGSTLLLRFHSSGDLDPSTQPLATVDGTAIRIELNDECAEIYCDVFAEHFFRVDLPPLAEGEYVATVYWGGGDSVRGTFELAVGPESALADIDPAEGFWMPVGQPGTGLHVQHRGATLAVSQFDQAAIGPLWSLDAVPLHGNSAIVVLRYFASGSCIGCTPHEAPDAGDGTPMRLVFASSRTATAELADGTVVPLVNLAFGADYVDVELAPDDEVFGSLHLPDLSGRWAIPSLRSRIITFGLPQVGEGGVVTWPGTTDAPDLGTVAVECSPASAEHEAGCFLSDVPVRNIAFAALGDVGEERIHFRVGDSAQVWHAVRVPEGGLESNTAVRPADGFWSVPGQPGTGLHFQARDELLAVTAFDFVDGDPHWRLGVATLEGAGAEVTLQSFSGGSCFGCTPHAPSVATDDPPATAIDFDSARRATVDLGDGSTIPVVNLAFGSAYVDVQLPGAGDVEFGPLALPDLSGTWAFDLAWDTPNPHVVTLHGPVLDGDTVRFARDPAEGELFALICRPGTELASAGCELRVGDLEIGTPPPGWHPFAKLGDVEENRMRFVTSLGGTNDSWRVFHAVRVTGNGQDH